MAILLGWTNELWLLKLKVSTGATDEQPCTAPTIEGHFHSWQRLVFEQQKN